MKALKLKGLFFIAVCLLAGLTATGCTTVAFAPPPAADIVLINHLSVDELQAAYVADPRAADARYQGRRFNFGLVRADQVVNSYFAVNNNEDYVLSGLTIFKPRQTKDIKGIIQGTVFEVIGDVRGLSDGKVVVADCWFSVVSGGRGNERPGGLY